MATRTRRARRLQGIVPETRPLRPRRFVTIDADFVTDRETPPLASYDWTVAGGNLSNAIVRVRIRVGEADAAVLDVGKVREVIMGRDDHPHHLHAPQVETIRVRTAIERETQEDSPREAFQQFCEERTPPHPDVVAEVADAIFAEEGM